MKCPRCGKELNSDSHICPHCNNVISRRDNTLPEKLMSRGKKKKRQLQKRLAIILGCGLLALLIAVVGIFLFSDSSSFTKEEGTVAENKVNSETETEKETKKSKKNKKKGEEDTETKESTKSTKNNSESKKSSKKSEEDSVEASEEEATTEASSSKKTEEVTASDEEENEAQEEEADESSSSEIDDLVVHQELNPRLNLRP